MRAWRLAPLGGAVALAVIPASAWAASGTTVASGWWTEASVGPLAAPSSTPSNQLQVSNGFSGPLAFAAVRITVPSGTPAGAEITLSLSIPSGSTVGTPSVSACPTKGAWKSGADQPASSAPGYSCQSGHQADGQPASGRESWVFPLSWGDQGTVSVALVPTPGTSAPFSISYAAPTPASIAVSTSASSSSEPSPYAGQSYSANPGTASSAPPAAGGGQAGNGAFTNPSSAGAVAVTPAGAGSAPAGGPVPSLGAVPVGTQGSGPSGPTGGAAAVGSTGGTGGVGGAVAAPVSAAPGGGTLSAASGGRGGRIMAFCLLVATGLALFYLSAQPDRAPRLLGPLASGARKLAGQGPASQPPALAGAAVAARTAGPVRGIGRFARERSGPPKRL